MTIYHSFTQAGTNYHIIDDFEPTDTIIAGDVYKSISVTENGGICLFTKCADCAVDAVCDAATDEARLKAALKLAPNLLTNFPELGV